MVMEQLGNSYDEANKLLKEHGSVRKAVDAGKK